MARDIISSNSDAFMLKKGVSLNEKAIEYIKTQGYMGVYISDLMSADVEPEEVVDQLTIRKGLEAVESENVGAIINVSAEIVAQITAKNDVSIDLFDLRSYDDYTFHHSVNVGVFAVAVGRKMGLNDEELNLLSTAGICHDLGKSKIDIGIINKPGRLTDEEFQEIKNHPRYSFEILSNNPEVPSVVKQAALMHHENENGSGYPLGKEGRDIPLFAKIIHAVDVYDALTCKRAYKDPFAPVDALEYLNSGRGTLFDSKIVDVILKVIPAYPPGMEVSLSNGEVALVVSHTQNALRPKIKLSSNELINLETNPDYKDITIVKSGIMPTDYVGDIDMLNEDRQAVREIKTKAGTVVIVDDSFIILQSMIEALESNYNIVTFQSGFEAVKYFSNPSNHADLLIMDIEMPIMDGITAVKNLKKKGDFNIPVIFLTTDKSRETLLECAKLSATDIVLKPVKPDYIKTRVGIALTNSIESTNNPNSTASSPKKSVMVVDDSGMVLRNMMELLGDTYEVILANSAAKAIIAIEEKKPDLILLDNNMPECSGEELFIRLRGQNSTKDIPIVFLTSVSDIATVKRLLDLKPDGYLLKSTMKADILKTLSNILK